MALHYNEEIFAKFLKDTGHPAPQPPRPSVVDRLLSAVTGK